MIFSRTNGGVVQMLRKSLIAAVLSILAIAIGSVSVYAGFDTNYSATVGMSVGTASAHSTTGALFFKNGANEGYMRAQNSSDAIVVDTNSDVDLADEAFIWAEPTIIHIVSDNGASSRSVIEVKRVSEGVGTAKMESSAGASVSVESDGDIVFTLGN